jgi:hypothetical protein
VLKIAVALFGAALAAAEVRSVCLEDRVGLSNFTRKAFEAEVRQLIPAREVRLSAGPCLGPAVTIVIATHPPARYSSALGLAHRNGDRVFPELRLYTQPVLKTMGEQTSAAQLGRALARVAAHELGHYLLQQTNHDDEGLMRRGFESSELRSEDSAPFRTASHR